MKHRKLWIGVFIGVIVILVAGIGGFVYWVSNPYPAMPEALVSMESDSRVQVETDPWISFIPQDQQSSTGFILYPGGLVEAEAYAPSMRALAESGYLAIIIPMPLNLAVLNSGAATDVITAHPEVKNWVIGGHSLGGSMAASFADQNPELIDGLVLWASYPAESNNLADQSIAVASVYGTLDGVALPETVLTAAPLLPADTLWIAIEGGNHAQFGWYGSQEGDNPAAISREEQQVQVLQATFEILHKVEAKDE